MQEERGESVSDSDMTPTPVSRVGDGVGGPGSPQASLYARDGQYLPWWFFILLLLSLRENRDFGLQCTGWDQIYMGIRMTNFLQVLSLRLTIYHRIQQS